MAWDEAVYIIDEVLRGIDANQISGIPPQNIPGISMSVTPNTVHIKCKYPEDTIIYGQTICTVRGVRVVRKENEPPKDPFDGTIVGDFIKKHYDKFEIVDKNLVNSTAYYYHFYPYNSYGVFNYNDANLRLVIPKRNTHWGFRQRFTDLVPETSIYYYDPSGSIINGDYSPMMTNSANGEVTAGSWGSFLTDVLKNKPYMVRRDGTADYQLDPNDYTKKLNGEPSDYNNLDYDGGAFAWLNKLYMKDIPHAGDGRLVIFSTGPEEGFEPIGFIDPDGNELEGVWLPMGYMDDKSRVLISGTTPNKGTRLDQGKDLIDAFSPRAVFFGGPIINVLRDLEYLMFRTTDIQKAAGKGLSGGSNISNPTANDKVPNGPVVGWFGESSGNVRNKYFHSQVIGGYNTMLRDPYVLYVDGTQYISPRYVYDLSGDTLIKTGIELPTVAKAVWWWPSRLLPNRDAFGSVPEPVNDASNATGLCDACYINVPGAKTGIWTQCNLGYRTTNLNAGPAFCYTALQNSSTVWHINNTPLLLPPFGYSPE